MAFEAFAHLRCPTWKYQTVLPSLLPGRRQSKANFDWSIAHQASIQKGLFPTPTRPPKVPIWQITVQNVVPLSHKRSQSLATTGGKVTGVMDRNDSTLCFGAFRFRAIRANPSQQAPHTPLTVNGHGDRSGVEGPPRLSRKLEISLNHWSFPFQIFPFYDPSNPAAERPGLHPAFPSWINAATFSRIKAMTPRDPARFHPR